MIVGTVSEDGIPIVTITIHGEDWLAIIDTGFNGDLELPEALRSKVNARYTGRISSALAGGSNDASRRDPASGLPGSTCASTITAGGMGWPGGACSQPQQAITMKNAHSNQVRHSLAWVQSTGRTTQQLCQSVVQSQPNGTRGARSLHS